jgi:6-phospho-3-hexuloisomerase
MQIGLDAHVVGDATTPSIGTGDLLIALSGSGRTETVVNMARKLKPSA